MARDKSKVRKQCDTCLFWLHGDPIGKVGNMGICIFMLQQEAGFYNRPEHVPFWAGELTRRTTSWEGQGCATWKEKGEANAGT